MEFAEKFQAVGLVYSHLKKNEKYSEKAFHIWNEKYNELEQQIKFQFTNKNFLL